MPPRMDECSGKRAIDGLVVSRKGSGLVLRDAANNRDRNAQFCNRVGCSGRPNSMKGAQMSCSEKAKSSRPLFRSAPSSKEIVGSSKKISSANNPRKSFTESRRKVSSQLETDSSESSVQDEPQVSKIIPMSRTVQEGHFPQPRDVESGKDIMMEVASSSVAANTRSRRSANKKSGFGTRDTVPSSVPLASKSTSQATRANANRYGLRNLRCNSFSDVVPSGCSTPDSNLIRRKDVPKKRNCEGESSSSARGKMLSRPSSEERNSSLSYNITISDSRRARNCPPPRDNIVGSVRTRRSTTGYNGAGLSNQDNGNISSPNESPVISVHISTPESSIDLNSPSQSHQVVGEVPFNRQSSYNRPGSSSGGLRNIMPTSPRGVGITRSLMNRDGFRHCNMDGIAEVLLALERIEQDEELTYEQLLVLETNLFTSGLNFYDQHREMRLDIDNMSYEELLALEERMGSVSTALTEEALSKCLERIIYDSIPDHEITGCVVDKDEIKCSICQEEYAIGDELGRLQCEHTYHACCIHQWLRLKNWCPICKTAAGPASPSPSPSRSSSSSFSSLPS